MAPPLGLAAAFTSAMIYHDTCRTSWRFPLTATRFFGTVLCFAALGHAIAHPTIWTALLFGAAVLAKMIPEARRLNSASTDGTPGRPTSTPPASSSAPSRPASSSPLTALANP